eukprot:TRINITY_DN25913_c0_g1_i1.p1 TRINITY_DN25913_c0_g1~~TRINITY_DN25913_c0_g1_i1.p1  ORF type:complete len:220 (-),score=106.71 TRINITY_DN25913_c0_g1_i1:34-693(-)
MPVSDEQFAQLLMRLEAVTFRLETVEAQLAGRPTSGAAPAGAEEATAVNPRIAAYDEFLKEFVTPFVDVSKKIGGDCEKATALFAETLQETRGLIEKATEHKKPTDEKFGELIAVISKPMCAAGELKDKAFRSKEVNHVNAIAEAVQSLGWVAVPNTPVAFINDMKASAVFHTNKILVTKDEDGMKWAKALPASLDALQKYVKEHHMTGLTWNPRGEAL